MTHLKYNFIFSIVVIFITGCSLSPGMHMDYQESWLSSEKQVYVESLGKNLSITPIEKNLLINQSSSNKSYKIGIGDQIAITVWGLPDIFPIANISSDTNLRRVDSNGNLFFPYAGIVNALNKTQDELRDDLTYELSKNFNEPQLDVSIARFNSQKVYLLGEVTKPSKIAITDRPLSLADALGQSFGLSTNTSNGSEVFIIRQSSIDDDPYIFVADLSSPSGFISAGNFYLSNNDIVYVNAKGTTRWNRVISQFFPFSSFLNSVDNLISD